MPTLAQIMKMYAWLQHQILDLHKLWQSYEEYLSNLIYAKYTSLGHLIYMPPVHLYLHEDITYLYSQDLTNQPKYDIMLTPDFGSEEWKQRHNTNF